MIDTARLQEIDAILKEKLPLETHGSNAFDATTRITVGDLHGMIARIRDAEKARDDAQNELAAMIASQAASQAGKTEAKQDSTDTTQQP